MSRLRVDRPLRPSALSAPRGPRSARAQRGTVLTLVAVLGVLLMALWATAWRATHDRIRTERFVVERAERDRTVTAALAAATAWLGDGQPPANPFECIFVVLDGHDKVPCTATYRAAPDKDVWTIEVHPSTSKELGELPLAPER